MNDFPQPPAPVEDAPTTSAFSTQTQPPQPGQPDLTSNSQPSKSKRRPLLVALGSVAILCLILGMWLLAGPKQVSAPNMDAVTETPAPDETLVEASPDSIKPIAQQSNFYYKKEFNIFGASTVDLKEFPVTTDGSQVIEYFLPKSYADGLTYVKCVRENGQVDGPYRCALVLEQNGEKRELASLQSKPNGSGYQLGGYHVYAISADLKTLFYVQEYTDSTVSDLRFYKTDLVTGASKLLQTLEPTPGRGGMLDEEGSLTFSPDEKKLVYTDTSMWPFYGQYKKATIFVFDVASGELVWDAGAQLAFFGRWVDNNQLIYQVTEMKDNGASNMYLVSFDSSQPKPVESLYIKNTAWNNVGLKGAGSIFYNLDAEVQGAGQKLYRYDIGLSSSTLLRENLQLIKPWDEDRLLVFTMQSCAKDQDRCGFDMFNGVFREQVALYNWQTGELTPFAIADLSTITFTK